MLVNGTPFPLSPSFGQKYFGLRITTVFLCPNFPTTDLKENEKKTLFVFRATLLEPDLPESHGTSSSSISDTVAQESVPHCYCENGKSSTDYSISSESSNISLVLSDFPIFPERTTWQIQSNIVPDSPEKELAESRSQSTPLPYLTVDRH